jgi:CRISPR-associated protein Csd2
VAYRRNEGEDDTEKRGDKRTMGRKHIVPYGLYRAHGYVSAPLATDDRKGTGFTDEDLELLFTALGEMLEHDRSAARGEMATRKLVIFRHASALGSAHAQDLFGRVMVRRKWLDDTRSSKAGVTPCSALPEVTIRAERERPRRCQP